MTDETWRPLGTDDAEEIAAYDALHDGIPAWLNAPLWDWIRDQVTTYVHGGYGGSGYVKLNVDLVEQMAQTLHFAIPSFRRGVGVSQTIDNAIYALKQQDRTLQLVDYLLAHHESVQADALEALLVRNKSVWQVGTRAEKRGLVRRVALGVQAASDDIMLRSGHAGIRLAKAWEALYGIDPNPSEAYRLAIQAVEDAAVPVVSPSNGRATLGTVLKQLEDQHGWTLPMQREHVSASSIDVVIGMARMLWHGQHDRHGGQPSAPGDVSIDEATAAVTIAVSLVHLFNVGLVQRHP